MDGQKVALSVAIIILAVVCFIVGVISLAIPYWGVFTNRLHQEHGHFGPWSLCKDEGYGRKSCGTRVSMFRPIFLVKAAGTCSAIGMTALGLYCIMSIGYISMKVKDHRDVIRKRYLLLGKILLCVISALMGITAVSLFSAQKNDFENGYIVNFYVCFYLQIVVTIFSGVLFLITIGEYYSVREDWTFTEHVAGRKKDYQLESTTYGNPGAYQEGTNGSISVTDSSLNFVPSHMKIDGPTMLQVTQLQSKNKPKKKRRRRPNSSSSSGSFGKRISNGSNSHSKYNNDAKHWNGSLRSISMGSSNGSSMSSLATFSTTASVSSVPSRSVPLRSSLKKPSKEPFGIQNPSFSPTSPTLSRTGSLKKVRIQTQQTDV